MPEKNRLLVMHAMGSLTFIKLFSYLVFIAAISVAILDQDNGDEHFGLIMALIFLGVLATVVYTVLKALHDRVSDLENRMGSELLNPSVSSDRKSERTREQEAEGDGEQLSAP